MKKNRFIIAGAAILLTILFSSCATSQVFVEGPDVIPHYPTITTTPVDKQVRLVDSGPVHGGTLTLATTDIDSLNPFSTSSRYVNYISLFIYEPLFIQLSESKFESWLVDSYSHEEFTVWNFNLKKGVSFHNGRELTSYDVKYTIRS